MEKIKEFILLTKFTNFIIKEKREETLLIPLNILLILNIKYQILNIKLKKFDSCSFALLYFKSRHVHWQSKQKEPINWPQNL